MTPVCEIATRRLHLVPCVVGDLAEVHRLWTESEARRWLWDGRIISLDESRAAVRASMSALAAGRPGQWSVCLVGGRGLIGYCGMLTREHPFFDEQQLPREVEYELFFGVAPEHRRQGYATEVVAAVLKCAFEDFRIRGVAAIADVPNRASVRILQAVGMEAVRRQHVGEQEIIIYAMDQADYRLRATLVAARTGV